MPLRRPEILAWGKERFAATNTPIVEFVQELPKNASARSMAEFLQERENAGGKGSLIRIEKRRGTYAQVGGGECLTGDSP
jgi:hypothetical protein